MKLFSTLPPSLVWVLDKGRKEVLSDGTVSTYFKGKVPIRMFQEMEKFFKSENAFQRDLRTNEVNYSLSRDEHSISMTLNRKSRTLTITFNNYEALFGKVASVFQGERVTMSLRKKIIRLAYQNPELRGDLLPLLKESSNFDPQEIGKLKKKKHIDKDDDYLSDEFTQQEFSELRKKQQSGKLASSPTSFAAFREKMKMET